jgi:hypothetical protein
VPASSLSAKSRKPSWPRLVTRTIDTLVVTLIFAVFG